MRFNKQELFCLALQPSNKFEKEGILFLTERQESFFRKTEGETLDRKGLNCINLSNINNSNKKSILKSKRIRSKSLSCIGGISKVSLEKWCRLRGNLLFYLKTNDQFSEPQGVIVLEKYRVSIHSEAREYDGFAFYLEFEDGLTQRLSAHSEQERTDWIQAIRLAGYDVMRAQLQYLRDQIEKRRGNRIDVDVDMHRLQTGKEIDITEVPICESSISCDNLICDAHGRSPNASIVVQVSNKSRNWIKYGRTEVIERSSNPQFLCTITFRSCDGLDSDSIIRFTAYDVREKVSQTAVPLGYAEISLGVIQDTTRLRIPIRCQNNNVGFITIVTFTPENAKRHMRSPEKVNESYNHTHRRSQSLPPKLGVKLFVPSHMKLPQLFANPSIHTYRLHSGLGGDISVHEFMLESKLCYVIPQQLLSIWIMREKELLQEISGMGELGGEWRARQMDLLDKHLKLLKDYSQAKQCLQQYNGRGGKFYKPSPKRNDETLEFAPINLHLQRMCAHNDTLKRSGILDVITVGCFTRHTGKTKTGGLIKLLHQIKDSPNRIDQIGHKVAAANDVVQSIKQLRKEIVEIMSQLLLLAKNKNPKGMLPLCNEMMSKTRALLNIWEPGLVEEAFHFIERHRIIDEPDNSIPPLSLSPFKKITQQLGALDLKSPELEDFATPMEPMPDLWPQANKQFSRSPSKRHLKTKSPSTTDIQAISNLQDSVKNFNHQTKTSNEQLSQSLPPIILEASLKHKNEELRFSETHFDVNGDVCTNSVEDNEKITSSSNSGGSMTSSLTSEQLIEQKNELLSSIYDENGYLIENTSIVLNHNGAFLDTKVICSSDFYRPSEEPEPLDLTQLNVEASVMCLVSKVKFLCGRCGSPAVRLRQPRNSVSSMKRFNSLPPDVVTSQPISTNNSNGDDNQTTNSGSGNPTNTNKPSLNGKDLNLALTEAVGEVTRKVKGNKFTDGLDLSMTTDWASELRPSMKKLRQAMDGLLKTARLMHSVQRLQQDSRKISSNLSIMYRRDICFSQALTSLLAGLMTRLWATHVTEHYVNVLCGLGPLCYFEGLLSLYGSEMDMWSDMNVAIEDLSTVNFTLVRNNPSNNKNAAIPMPRVIGSRQAIVVLLPVPDYVYDMLPPSNGEILNRDQVTFKVTPVFFNIGVNEYATIAETLGYTKEQHRSNWDNFDRLKQYHIRYKKIPVMSAPPTPSSSVSDSNSKDLFIHPVQLQKDTLIPDQVVSTMLNTMEDLLKQNVSKNVKILHIAEDICRAVQGVRFTSCKSAKDRTSMAVTLEQCRILQQEFHLPATNLQRVLDTMRSEGTRSDNVLKNIGARKYAFNLPQVLALPQIYRPPQGSYGKGQT